MQRGDICPECGTPLDEIPFKKCSFHAAHAADEEEALRRALHARPMSEKIRGSASFEELREHLAEWAEEYEGEV